MIMVSEILSQLGTSLPLGQNAPAGIWIYLLLMVLIVIQGPVSTMLGGAAAAAGLLNPLGVLVVALVGNLGADVFWYSLGYSGKDIWRRRFFRRYRNIANMLRTEMQRHAVTVLLMAKLSVGMAVPTVIAAGLAQVPWRRWFPPVVVGELIWTGSLLLVGYYATESIMRSEWAVVQFGIIVSVVLFVLMVLYVLRKSQQEKKAH